MRTIKKYPNRRLYDTERSSYITLRDIRELVNSKEEFVVIDKKSGDDITRAILMQVISEQEQNGEPVMTEDFLSQIIRSYSNVMPSVVSNYLEQSLKMFIGHQSQARDRIRKVVGVDPVDAMTGLAQRNYQRWKNIQDEVFKRLGTKSSESSDKKPAERSKTGR